MHHTKTSFSPREALGSGLLAGVIGTAAMTAWQMWSAKLQSGESEPDGAQGAPSPEPEDPWESASAPAKVAKRIGEGVLKRNVSPELIPLLTHATHWGYGAGWGTLYGVATAGAHRRAQLRDGLLFGTAVWVMSYVQLVPMGLYELPWKYPPKELAMDLSYHLVYGAGVAGGFRILQAR